MKKLKVITSVGTRPEIIRLSRVIAELDKHCDHTLVHTGQNYDYELSEAFFDDLKIKKPKIFLNCAKSSVGVSNTIGNLITSFDEVLSRVQPEALLVLGDTNSCLSVIPAKRRKVPIFHMEAGNRCFDERVPEETNRRIVDHVADINLTYSSIAREYLLREGFAPDRVIKTGSPMYEVLNHYMPQIKTSNVLKKLGVQPGSYFLVSVHREENVEPDQNFEKIVTILNSLAANYGLPVIVSTHPRTKRRVDETDTNFNSLVKLLKPLGFFDYIQLQMNAKAVLSDSGTITEESSILHFPALNLREAHERPEGMEEASVMMVGLDIERVMQVLKILENQQKSIEQGYRLVVDYSVPDVSKKVLRIIHSYTGYVNRVVWKKF